MTITDQLGIAFRGVQGQANKIFQAVTAGGSTNTGAGTNLPFKLPQFNSPRITRTRINQVVLPPVGTSPTPGRSAAPHPTYQPTVSTLGRGFRSIRG